MRVQRPEASNLIKKETLAQVFSCEFCEIFKTTFFYRTPLVAASVISFTVVIINGLEYLYHHKTLPDTTTLTTSIIIVTFKLCMTGLVR